MQHWHKNLSSSKTAAIMGKIDKRRDCIEGKSRSGNVCLSSVLLGPSGRTAEGIEGFRKMPAPSFRGNRESRRPTEPREGGRAQEGGASLRVNGQCRQGRSRLGTKCNIAERDRRQRSVGKQKWIPSRIRKRVRKCPSIRREIRR